ncbi:hypothetical protein PVAND_007668 [Polypedilum vanderplanki]|uniref:Chitinase n=1 Tax=Polypedilum vanderplanki TaxID=319348 RepID=A0A9J6C827_POLVA|nr:hypothetical protein PVAND_007668 [Polypedilum vanderplanki]
MILGVFLLVSFAISNAQDYCGLSGKYVGLVVNGTQTERGTWRWLVAIYKIEGNQLICGGTLVSADTVVTAAHCMQDKSVKTPRSPNEIVIKLGRYDLSENYERGAIDAYANDIFIHPNWKYYNTDYDSDIAVIKLTTPVIFNDVIMPICMWSSSRSSSYQTGAGIVAGFGRSERGGKHENIAREIEVKIKTNEECFLKKAELAKISSLNTFCAGNDHGGVCRGDSGSGLYINHQNRWYLQGIVSSSLVDNNECDTSNDAVYTNVAKFIDWINQMIDFRLSNLPIPSANNFDDFRRNRKEIICYIPNWTMYRSEKSFSLNNFKPELCTTAVYMFAGLDEDGGIKSIDPWADLEDQGGLNGFKRFTSLKKTFPHLRTLLSIGGWNEGVEKYSKFVSNPLKRKGFALQSAEFLRQYNFDGLDFYWDFPANPERGGSPNDKENFVLLLKDLNVVYSAAGLFLSVTMRAAKWITDIAYNLTAIADYADMMNMMNFDHSGVWDKKIGYSAALYKKAKYPSIEDSIQIFLNAKVPPSKLTVGIPFYARTFLTTGDGNIGDESEREAEPGPIIKDNSLIGFNEICLMKKEKQWFFQFDQKSSQMIGKYLTNGKHAVAVFDSPRSVANKVKYAMEKNLRGVWAWSIDMDDFDGDCEIDETVFNDYGPRKPQIYHQRDFPLLRTMNIAMKFLNN